MTDAPDRIWAQRTAHGNWDEPIATPYEVTHFSEYVRADTLDARDATIAELVEALERATNELEDEVAANYPPEMLTYPHNQQKMANDLEAVTQARAALAKATGA